MVEIIQIFAIAVSVLAFGMALWLYTWVKAQPKGSQKIETIGEYIQKAPTHSCAENMPFWLVSPHHLVVDLVVHPHSDLERATDNLIMALSFLVGTAFSALAGRVGIQVATIANRKSAVAAQSGIKSAFLAGFRGGAVMGMAVVGTSLLGVTAVFMLTRMRPQSWALASGPVRWPCSPKPAAAFSPRPRHQR
jgi:K(+)-stimulated pyrophosphate-energized sodium pump